MSPDSPDRFEPSAQQKAKQGKSASKRIALFVFIEAGIIFTLVATSILNSGGGVNGSNAPVNLFEASRGAQSIAPPRPKPPEPEPVQTPPHTPAPKPQPARPAYIPVPKVSDMRKQNQVQRLLAANSPTSIQAFREQTHNGGAAQTTNNNSDTLAEVSRLLSNAPANTANPAAEFASHFMPQQQSNIPDPNGWYRKDAFTQQKLPEQYSKHSITSPQNVLELKSGTLLPCVLISGLNSDLPGNMIAQVSENVWDTATGRYLLIPRGSRLIGTYDNQISYGQSRVLVLWSRLIFPDGSSLVLDNLKGADQSGYSGFKGSVNRHWGPIISSALLVSLLGAGVEIAAPTNNNNRDNNDPRSILAEKPSLARSIAAVLSKPQQNHKLYIKAGENIVAWAAGHLLEQAMPEQYDDKYKRWNVDDLPIFPQVWKMLVKKECKDLFDNLKKLLKQAEVVVNAGDCDREGQLLIDEILDYCGYKGKVLRILISDTNPEAVKNALDNLKPDSDFHGDRDAALARSRADWLHGINLTRLYTKMAERNGYNGDPLKIGRVKTPVTALVVRRDEDIEAFSPKPFWIVKANIAVQNGTFYATWKPKEEQQGLDEEKRLVDKSVADALVSQLTGKSAKITKYESKKLSSKPPVGFSLPKLQMIASKKFDLSPAKVLDICQKLYEQGILTYPRSDCEFLPDAHHDDAQRVFDVIEKLSSLRVPQSVDKSHNSPVFNSKKVEEHHAIIPSASCKGTKPLEGDEALIFELVARRYFAFFMPDYVFSQVNINADIDDELFSASGRHVLNDGWKAIESASQDNDDENNNDEDNNSAPLPETSQGENGSCNEINLLEKKTKAPARFSEATLLKAMNEVYRYVLDPEIKKILKETDGIGTAATQAGIIKELIDSGMLTKKGKNLISSSAARCLIHALPENITLPDLTAVWETYFRKIKDAQISIEKVINYIQDYIRDIISSAQPITVLAADNTTSKNFDRKKSTMKSNVKCPRCGAPMLLRNGKNGSFWGCSNYPECKMTADDNNGKPVFRK